MEKIAVLAPIPRTNVRIAINVKPGFLRRVRIAKRKSCRKKSKVSLPLNFIRRRAEVVSGMSRRSGLLPDPPRRLGFPCSQLADSPLIRFVCVAGGAGIRHAQLLR